MNCSHIRQQIEHSVEVRGEIDWDPYRQHLAECPDCRQLLDRETALDDAIRLWAGSVPTVDLTDRIVAAVRVVPQVNSERPKNFRGRSRALFSVAGLVAACSIITVISIRGYFDRMPNGKPVPVAKRTEGAASPQDVPSAVVQRDVTPSETLAVTETLKQTSREYLNTSRQVAGQWTDSGRNLLASGISGWPKTDTPSPEAVVEAPAPSGEGWNDRLQPISRDVGRAFGFLKHAVPNSLGESTNGETLF